MVGLFPPEIVHRPESGSRNTFDVDSRDVSAEIYHNVYGLLVSEGKVGVHALAI